MIVLVLIGIAAFALVSFRRAMAISDSPSERLLAEAERVVIGSLLRATWMRVAIATVVAWAGIMLTLTPVNPALAVWVGGGVVMVGTWAVVRSIPDPYKIDDAEFDRQLRELLDQNR